MEMEAGFYFRAFWGLVALLGALVVVIYNFILKDGKKDLLLLEQRIEKSMTKSLEKLIQHELDYFKMDIKREVKKDYEHTITNIKQTKNLVIKLLDIKHKEIEETGEKYLKIIKNEVSR